MAIKFLIALATAFGSAGVLLSILYLSLKLFAPKVFQESKQVQEYLTKPPIHWIGHGTFDMAALSNVGTLNPVQPVGQQLPLGAYSGKPLKAQEVARTPDLVSIHLI